MNRADLLTAALDAVNARPKAYGPPERNFDRIASLWSAHTVNRYGEGVGLRFDAVDVACMMALMKIARLEETPDHMDSWTDLAGYAACGAECASGAVIEHDADERTEQDLRESSWYDEPHREAPAEPPRFKVGDRVIETGLPSEPGTIVGVEDDDGYAEVKWDCRSVASKWWAADLDHAGFKVGDRVVDNGGRTGVVTQVQDTCYQVKHKEQWYSYYPKEGWLCPEGELTPA